MAIEIQLEKLRVVEAMNARDLLVQKLSDAYTSVREKTELIDRLQQALNGATNTSHTAYSATDPQSWGQAPEMLQPQATDLEALIQDLSIGSRNTMGPPPKYEEEVGDDISLCLRIHSLPGLVYYYSQCTDYFSFDVSACYQYSNATRTSAQGKGEWFLVRLVDACLKPPSPYRPWCLKNQLTWSTHASLYSLLSRCRTTRLMILLNLSFSRLSALYMNS